MIRSMAAWQYRDTKGGLEYHLRMNASAKAPEPKPDCHLVRVLATSLNPVDYKLSEIALINRIAIKKPACPGLDVAGRIVVPAAHSGLKSGQLVFGTPAASALLAGGGLAEYINLPAENSTLIPPGLTPSQAASIPTAGLTAWQTIVPYIKPGARIFINGGSGGVGTFAIQIAKLNQCNVTCSCSSANVDLCKSLGADEVIDYTQGSVVEALKSRAGAQRPFDHVVDYVGSNHELFWRCHEYTVPNSRYVSIAATPSYDFAKFTLQAYLWPGFLGGGQRKLHSLFGTPNLQQITQIAKWMAESKLRAVIDQEFAFGEATEAMMRLKTGRTKGKIVVLQ